MIVKVIPKSKSFKKLDYICRGKMDEIEQKIIEPILMFYSDNLEIPVWAEDTVGIKRMIGGFENQTRFHQNYDPNRPYVGHHILSFSQEDIQLLSRETIYQIVHEYIIDAGWEETQYVAVGQCTHNRFYVHFVYNRCLNSRILYKDWKEKIKATERTIKLNIKYQLPLLQKQIDMAKNSPDWEIIHLLDKYENQ